MGYRSWAPWVVALAWACGGSAVEAAPKKGGNLKTIQYVARDVSGKYDLQVTLTAGHVNKATLDLLRQGLRFELVDKSKRKDLDFWEDDPLEPKSGEPEVRIDARPLLPPPAGSRFVWRWPEIFVISRPGILTIRPEYSGIHPTQRLPRPTLPPPGDTFEHLSGRLECEAPDGTGTVRNPIPHVRVRVGEREATTDAAGNFTLDLEFDDVPPTLRLVYDSTVPKTGTPLATPFSIIDDFHQARTEDVTLPGRAFIAGDTVVLPAVTVQGGDCEIWRIGVASLQDYHDEVGASPPAGRLRIKRWWGVLVGGIYAFYDYVVLRSDFVDGVRRTASGRLNTLHHEFGHTIRHFADGDEYHWNWDNFRWVYARAHDGDEIFSMHYAFNEGWAQYWEAASLGQTVPTGGVPGLDYMDWNEMRIGERLLDLGAPGEATRAQMVQVLTDNPGVIHTLWEFEQKYCELIRDNTYCAGGRPVRTPPADCPPEFHNDGAFCRFDNIRAKPSYGRGAGVPPTECGAGQENDVGLCYPVCREGFNGVLTGCYQFCPAGYADHGLTCWRDGHIFGSDNSACPWWDVCGVATERGCSTCPADYNNDGCTCRRDPHVFGKEIYDRGAGRVPTICTGGMENDTGLCYTPCTGGFHGAGPVCWGSCPAGFADHGATCYADPNVFTRF